MLPIAKGKEHRGNRPQLYAHVAKKQRNIGDTGHFEKAGTDPLRSGRRLNPHELLGGQDKGHFVGETRQPIDAVDQRGDLRVGADFGQLLVAPMHVSHVRHAFNDLLTVELGNEAQSAVGGGVLGTDVDGHAVVGRQFHIDPHVRRLGGDVCRLLQLLGTLRGEGGFDRRRPWLNRCRHDASAPSSSASPAMGSTLVRPGHGFTSRAKSGKSLRIG